MDKAAWEELKQKGWKEGDSAEFLGLTREEAAFVEIKLKLSDAVRSLRRERATSPRCSWPNDSVRASRAWPRSRRAIPRFRSTY